MQGINDGRDLNVLDVLALVMGSAIACVHVLRIMRGGLSSAGWVMACLMFAYVSLTAAGPFVFMERKYSRRLPGYPRTGDILWAMLGLPWVVSALLQAAMSDEDPRQNPLFFSTLTVGLALACTGALAIIWGKWVVAPPHRAEAFESGPWTNRVGLFLAVAWPIQCGLGMAALN
ncbi:hypothetical protein OJF2_47180 [Aquisphaera giovannonii]|uniref:Uncharacterized protein n=1 Tax=Aquisphaera giovannonii TaxID=406548 RepID=A0A5B9W6I4_9BACT|nr:hypothetical protein [Aquisphaera giovannonii]QEH36158.1 hypothetical protein OJF2_47180 [Aquisphaera giovannonii]